MTKVVRIQALTPGEHDTIQSQLYQRRRLRIGSWAGYVNEQGYAATLLLLALPNLQSLELDRVPWDLRVLLGVLGYLNSRWRSEFVNLSHLSFQDEFNFADQILSGFMALPSMRSIELSSVRFSRKLADCFTDDMSSNLSSIWIVNSDVSTKAFSTMLKHIKGLRSFTYGTSAYLWDPNRILKELQKYARESLQHITIYGRSTGRVAPLRDTGILGEFKELRSLGLCHRLVMAGNVQNTFRRILPPQIEILWLYVDLEEFKTNASMLAELEVLYQAAKTHLSEARRLEKIHLVLFSGTGGKVEDEVLTARLGIPAKFLEPLVRVTQV